ncbi:MAG: murein L,D-transpeptidase family protein [Pseudomonadota bacterium]
MKSKASKRIAVVFAGSLLAACNGVLDSSVPKHERPVPEYLVKKMETKGMSLGAPILLRIFKEENVMEVWKQDHNKRYAFLNSYEICKWSGELGPKHQEGDRQAPEGFYHVTQGLMNPNSSYHLSFNMGFPNTYDQANDRTGSYLMIHGACSSAGCYSMTDEYVEEIYALARESFRGGQKAFQIQAFPFRMTAENMAKKVDHPDFQFWKMLKEGSDHFEVTKLQPKVDVCEKRYVFNRYVEEGVEFRSRAECPPAKMPRNLALAFNEKQDKDQSVFDKVLKKTASNPFIKDEDKPKVQVASIKADATVGPVGILEPKPVVQEVPETAVASTDDAANTDQQVTVEAKPDGESINPISAEITGTQAATTSITVQPVTSIAVPQKAQRTEPQS